MPQCKKYRCKTQAMQKSRYCGKHKRQAEKKRNPISYRYSCLKQNAKKRGIVFTLTISEFREWCEKVQYLKKVGITKDSFNIDRVIASRGYEKNNLQLINMGLNTRKTHMDAILHEKYFGCKLDAITIIRYKRDLNKLHKEQYGGQDPF